MPGFTKHKEDKGDYNPGKKKKKMRQPVEMEPEPAEVRHNDLNYIDLMHHLSPFSFPCVKLQLP